MKLGLGSKALESLGYAELCIAFAELTESRAGEPNDLVKFDPMREYDLNYDAEKAQKAYANISLEENHREALIIAFSKMIEANNDALLTQLKHLGVFDE